MVTQAISFQPLGCDFDVTFFPHLDGNPPLEMCGASVLPRWPFAVVTDFFAQDALTGESTGKARCATGLFSFLSRDCRSLQGERFFANAIIV
jgi:hypothetical protein